MGDLTADIRSSFATDALDNASQNLTRDLCAGTLVGATVAGVQAGTEIVVLDNLEIVYLAEDRSDATDLTIGDGGVLECRSFSAQRSRTIIHIQRKYK